MNYNPRNIAFINAALITILYEVLFVAYAVAYHYWIIWPWIIGGIIIFFFSYLTIYFSFKQFIYKRLKVIYKTIGKAGRFDKNKYQKKQTHDVLDLVNQTVLEWRNEQQHKIDELQKMASYRREFLGNVSHELKTPIFNIQGYILSLLDGGLEDKNISQRFLEKSEKSISRMIAIVEDLEEISRFESGELILHESVFDLNRLCREIADFLEIKAEKHRSKIIIKESQNKVIKVKADRKRIKQVLINLVDNAVKYGNQQEGKIIISFYDFHDNYLVEVTDNGMGIPEKDLPRIFERFFRTEKSRSRDNGGTGLGLAIVKHIIEAHRQSISVRSKPSKGTTFSFTIKKG